MDETKKEETKEEAPAEKGEKETKKTAIEAAKELADRIDAANQKTEELLQRQENLHAEQMLGGHAQAGQVPEEPKEETDKEYSDKVMAGDVPE